MSTGQANRTQTSKANHVTVKNRKALNIEGAAMPNPLQWIKKHKFESHLAIFLMIIIPSMLMYPIGMNSNTTWTWVLLGIIVIANIILLVIK